MSNQYNTIGLYDHNAESYQKIAASFQKQNVVGIVHATGTGKSYNALQLAYDNKTKRILYIVPLHGIIEHLIKTIKNNPNLNIEKDFPNLEFRTYQSFINLSREDISKINVDILILDEFHHLGAPVWGSRINTIIETHPNIKVFGMTAYTVRDRGTAYERDMANSEANELFSNKIVSRYDLCDAMADGVLPKPIYKSAYVNLAETEKILEKKVESLNATSKEVIEYMRLLADVKKKIHEAPSISDIVKRNIKPNGKYIYFCPPISEDGVNDINTIMEEAKKWFVEMGLTENDVVFYSTTSQMGIEGKNNREAFYNDVDVYGNSTDGKLRIMFAINQYNEGIHAPNVDGVIMGRGTTSDIVYFEQLGRALSVRGLTKEKFDEYEKYSLEELLVLCQKRDITIKKGMPKEEIIERLLAPIIIDLTNNYDFIKELENNLKDKIKEIQNKGPGNKRNIKIKDASFDIEIANQELFEILKYVSDRLTRTWEEMYEYAKIYYEHHGNLEIPENFKTNKGYEYDENGIIKLGIWIQNQRRKNTPESERGQLLSKIGMRFDNKYISWEEMYEYAKVYYEHHGNLEIPKNFKTNNGFEYDENGTYKLGRWIHNQRFKTSPESERGQLLFKIRMRFDVKKNIPWEEMYEYAKVYYEHHGNLEIPKNFKTNNGYEYDINGLINLGLWISRQREYYSPENERSQLLSQIGMRFETRKQKPWEEMYKYAKIYYEYHGNLEVPYKFTTNNGYEYDKNGIIKLGKWIKTQRERNSLSEEQSQLLLKLNMRFENKFLIWEKMYEYAKIYYEHHGNLEVPYNFTTNNGFTSDDNGTIKLGRWIQNQRQKTTPENERGQLLSQIGMRFETIKQKPWEEMYKYAKIYYEHHGNLEVPYNFTTNNGFTSADNGEIKLGQWIATQRYNEKSKESERRKLLSQIGMRFESNFVQWEEMYKYAKIYYEHHGNLEVPGHFKTNNGYEYDENGTINLGNWIAGQRQRTALSEEKKQLLLKLNMRFENKKLSWEEMYEYSKTYYEHHGNLEIPRNFKTNNGYEYDENGIINLGNWIFNQRRRTSPQSRQGQLLSQLCMIWNVKNNKDLTRILCKENTIDVKKNKKVLKNIPFQVFKAKIQFLKEKNIPLTNENGELHEIFAMSNIDFKRKYGISLEEIITKYSVTPNSMGGI